MKLPNLTDLTAAVGDAWPFLVSGGATLTVTFALVAYLARRPGRRGTRQKKMTLENKLTFLVALIIAGVCAQGMGKFFYDKLAFPITLVIVVGGVLELTAFTCALRARRNILDPNIGKAGVDGIAVWVVTALSGMFSAMDAGANEVGLFRLVMPLLAAWLWERGMSIERRRIRGGQTIHWRVTPERVLVWLRVAEPSGRTASEVDAHRRLTRVAKAAARLRTLRSVEAWNWRIERAEHRLERAMRSAVAHAGLAHDPARQEALIAQIGSLYNADALADLSPQAPWEGFTNLVQRTGFAVQGMRFTPLEFASRPLQVQAEVQETVREGARPEVHAPVHGEVHQPTEPEVHDADIQVREPVDPPVNQRHANQVREPAARRTSAPKHAKTRTTRTPNLGDRAERKANEVQDVVNLIHELGYDNVVLDVVRERLGFTKTTAYNRLVAARELVNQKVNQKAVNQ